VSIQSVRVTSDKCPATMAFNPPHTSLDTRHPSPHSLPVSRRSPQIAAAIAPFQGQDLNAHYLAFFQCFNAQRFYQAHDVLEQLWLAQRHRPDGPFYKGLIQLAGAFVHLQKDRLRPAASLFKLARSYLCGFPPIHQRLDVEAALALADQWLGQLESGAFKTNPLRTNPAPQLCLLG